MSFDMTSFYENAENKKEQIMEQTGADEATVMALLGDWREENLDIEALLQASNQSRTDDNKQQQLQIHTTTSPICNTSSASSLQNSGENRMMNLPEDIPSPRRVAVPTFSSSANRPSVLDLTTTIKYEPTPRHHDMNSHMSDNNGGASPHHSPHHSPYLPNNSTGVFNYNNHQQDQQQQNMMSSGQHSPHHMMHSPVSPHHPMESPLSPHQQQMGQQQRPPLSPHSSHRVSPVSPHPGMHMSNHSGTISPHSPHSPYSPHMAHHGSVSPVPGRHSPAPSSHVFGRYAGSSPVSMASTASTPDDDTKAFLNGGYPSCREMDSRKRHGSMSSDNGSVKGTMVYKAKRERNNIAVRKSREKKKQREAETEAKVKTLVDENTKLQSKMDVMLKEINLLKSLYKNIGVTLPQDARLKLENELAKFSN